MANNQQPGVVENLRKLATGVAAVLWVGAALAFDSRWGEESPVGITLFFVGCCAAGFGVLGRIWCLSYIAGHKTQTLIVEGPYSVCRNPLYLFSLISTVGAGMASCNFTIPTLAAIGFGLYYPAVIRSEARRLASLHGDAYSEYVRRTPAFFPNWSLYRESADYAVNRVALRRGLFDGIWFFVAFAAMHVVLTLHHAKFIPSFVSVF